MSSLFMQRIKTTAVDSTTLPHNHSSQFQIVDFIVNSMA